MQNCSLLLMMAWNDLDINVRVVRDPRGSFQLFLCGLKEGFAHLVRGVIPK